MTPSDAAVVLTDWVNSPTYTVDLVASNGCVAASAIAHRWPGYGSNQLSGQTVTMPTSESATRVYFLDGDSTVRFLGLDGSTGVAAQLPGSVTGKVSFSVNDDNTRIAFSVMTWGRSGFQEQSYVEDLGSGENRTELFTITGGDVAEEPIGWVNGNIVYGLLLATNEYNPGPDPPPFEAYHVASPSTGQRLASICAGLGNAWLFEMGSYTALPTAAGVLCRVGEEYQPFGTLDLVSWSGSRLRTIGDAPCASPTAVSPGGTVAVSGQVNVGIPAGQVMQCGINTFTIKVNAGGASTTLAVKGLAEGWMDDTHLVIDAGTDLDVFPFVMSGLPFPTLGIVNVSSGATAIVAVKGVFAGSVPSGI